MSEQQKNKTEEDYLRQHLAQLESKPTQPTNQTTNQPKHNIYEHNNYEAVKPKVDNSRTVDLQYQAIDIKHFPCGMFYPTGTVIMVRPALVKEVQAYSTVDDNNFPDVIDKMDDMLMSCVRIKYSNGDIGSYLDIKEQDRIFLLFMIRELTFQQGMYLTVNKECKCKNDLQIELSRANFVYFKPNTRINKFFDNHLKCFVFEYKGQRFEMTMPNIGLQKSFTEYITDEVSQKKEPNLAFLKIMPFLLGDRNKIDIKEIKEELKRFQSMSIDTFNFLNSAVTYMKFGIEKLMKVCDVCSEEVYTEMVFPNGASGLFTDDDPFEQYIN